jgi:hypothetical protein
MLGMGAVNEARGLSTVDDLGELAVEEIVFDVVTMVYIHAICYEKSTCMLP